MKIKRAIKKGFTLVEMTVVIVFGLAVAGAGMTLLTQQISIVRILNDQDFILKEAPRINQSLTALLTRADAIRLHQDFSDALADRDPVTANASVLVAAFRNPDDTTNFGIISFETVSGEERLNYYYFDPTAASPTQGNPSWSISRKVSDASFALVTGLFQTTLTGPNSESLTYTISPNQ